MAPRSATPAASQLRWRTWPATVWRAAHAAGALPRRRPKLAHTTPAMRRWLLWRTIRGRRVATGHGLRRGRLMPARPGACMLQDTLVGCYLYPCAFLPIHQCAGYSSMMPSHIQLLRTALCRLEGMTS